jgi:hypothetical protein
MLDTWSLAFMCHRYLPELIANWSLKSDPKLDAGSSADFSLVPLTWTGCEAASADGAIRKPAVARAADATILVRSDIGAIPVLRLPARPSGDPAALRQHRNGGNDRLVGTETKSGY